MKPIIIFLLFSFFQLNAQITSKAGFTAAELSFIKEESKDNSVYFIDNSRTIIAFNEGNFSILKNGKTYNFSTDLYSESNYKFKILDDANKSIGYGLINDQNEYDVNLYFDDKAFAKKFGNEVKFSLRNKVMLK